MDMDNMHKELAELGKRDRIANAMTSKPFSAILAAITFSMGLVAAAMGWTLASALDFAFSGAIALFAITA